MPLWFVFALLAEGLIVGALAQSVLAGVTAAGAVSLALVGAFLGGVIAWLFIDTGFGLVFALIGAAALIYARERFVAAR